MTSAAETKKGCEWVCKPGSVASPRTRRRPFICARRLLAASIATYPNVLTSRTNSLARHKAGRSILFGLAPDGVYRANRVTPIAGALLPHRFTLATRSPRRTNRSAVCSLLHFPWPHGRSTLSTILFCGARTFLPSPCRRSATVPPTHSPFRMNDADRLGKVPTGGAVDAICRRDLSGRFAGLTRSRVVPVV